MGDEAKRPGEGDRKGEATTLVHKQAAPAIEQDQPVVGWEPDRGGRTPLAQIAERRAAVFTRDESELAYSKEV